MNENTKIKVPATLDKAATQRNINLAISSLNIHTIRISADLDTSNIDKKIKELSKVSSIKINIEENKNKASDTINNISKGLIDKIDFTSILKKGAPIISDSDVDAIRRYNYEISNNVSHQTAWMRTMQNTSAAAQDLVTSNNGGIISTQQLSNAQRSSTISTALLSAKAFALNSVISLATSALISLGSKLWEMATTSNKAYIASLQDTIDTSSRNIENYKQEIMSLTDLQASLIAARGNKEKLLSISKELNAVIGNTPGLLSGESSSYDIANQKIQDRIIELKKLTEIEEKSKVSAQKEKFKTDNADYKLSIDPIQYAFNGIDIKEAKKSLDKYTEERDYTIENGYATKDSPYIESLDANIYRYKSILQGKAEEAKTVFQETIDNTFQDTLNRDTLNQFIGSLVMDGEDDLTKIDEKLNGVIPEFKKLEELRNELSVAKAYGENTDPIMANIDTQLDKIKKDFPEATSLIGNLSDSIKEVNSAPTSSNLKKTFEDTTRNMAEYGETLESFFDNGKINDKFSKLFEGVSDTEIKKNISKQFKGASESVQNGIFEIVKALNEGNTDYESSLKRFSFIAQDEVLNIGTEIASQMASSAFNGDSHITGMIDTWSELSYAMKDTAASIDLIETAQNELNSTGSVSISTALDLIQTNQDYSKILKIDTNGGITLVDNAEKVLVQTKIDAIKASAQQRLALAKAKVGLLEFIEGAKNYVDNMKNSVVPMTALFSGTLAYVSSISNDYANKSFKGALKRATNAANQAYKENNRKIDTNDVSPSLKVARSELKEAEDFANLTKQLTPENFSTNYKGNSKRSTSADSHASGSSPSYQEDLNLKDFNDQLAKLQHLREMDQKSTEAYYAELKLLNDKYLKDKPKYIEEYRKYQEEIYKGGKELYNNRLENSTKYIEDRKFYNDWGADNEIAALKRIATYTEEYYQKGIISYQEYISQKDEMRKKLHTAEMEQAQKDKESMESLLEATKEMLRKKKELESKALDDDLTKYKKKIDILKEELQIVKEKESFNRTLASKQKSVAKIEKQLFEIQYDDSAVANAKRLQLYEELENNKLDLDDYIRDKTYESNTEALDKELEDFEAQIEEKKKDIEKYLDNNVAITQDALNLINNKSNAFYKDLLVWNQAYGTGIDDDIIKKWDNAYDALDRYKELSDSINFSSSLSKATKLANNEGSKILRPDEFGNAPKNAKVGDIIVVNNGKQAYEIVGIGNTEATTKGKYNPNSGYTSKEVPVPKYAKGGVADYTGLLQIDGSQTTAETIFSSADSKKLFDLVHNTADLGELFTKKIIGAGFKSLQTLLSLNTNTQNSTPYSVNMPINVEGNLDSSVLPKLETIVDQTVKKINMGMQNKGYLRNGNQFSI